MVNYSYCLLVWHNRIINVTEKECSMQNDDANILKDKLPKLSDGEFAEVCKLFASSTKVLAAVEQHSKQIKEVGELLVVAAEKIQLLEYRIKSLEGKKGN